MYCRLKLTDIALVMALVSVLAISFPSPALADGGNATTTSTLSLVPTFQSISVYSNFTGDDNANNTTLLEYKPHSTSQWITAHTLTVDRRDQLTNIQLTGDDSAKTITNPFRDQWRGSIVGLSPNTQYDVRVTYSDADGVSGSNPLTSSVTTLDENIPLGSGPTYYVATSGSDTTGNGSLSNPWATIQNGINHLSAGSTLYIRGGTYYESLNISVSGSTTAGYITITNYPNEPVTLSGLKSSQQPSFSLYETRPNGHNIYRASYSDYENAVWYLRTSDNEPVLLYDYWALSDLEADSQNVNGAWARDDSYLYLHMPNNDNPNNYSIYIAYNSTGIDITANYIHLNGLRVAFYNSEAINVYGPYHHIVIDSISATDPFYFKGSGGDTLGNPNGPNHIIIRDTTVKEQTTFQQLWAWGPGDTTAIDLKATGGYFIFKNVTITGDGRFRDGIGGFDNDAMYDGFHRDSDIYDCHITNVWDDGIECEGGEMNIREWNNTITQDTGRMCLAHSAVSLGPVYDFRNVLLAAHDSTWKLGGGNSYSPSEGAIFIYQNTVYITSADGDGGYSYGNGISGFGSTNEYKNVTTRNNIFHVAKRVLERMWGGMGHSLDYDNFYSDSTDPHCQNNFWSNWGNENYSSLASFQAASGQEGHGINASSQFVNTADHDFHLQATSPCIDAGVVIPGFNDASSAWPYAGSAPDMGAFEFGATQPPNRPLQTYALTIIANAGGSTSPPVGTHEYVIGTVVQISAIPDSGWEFDSWSGNVADPESSVTTVIMDSDKAITANWKKLKYHLTLNITPPGITTIDGDGLYEPGTIVTTGKAPEIIYGTEGTRYVFSTWTVDNVERTGNPLSLTMDSPHQATANYVVQYYLRVDSEYSNALGAGWYDADSVAGFSVSPSVGMIIRHIFTRWSESSDETTPTASILMDSPKTVVGNWRTDYLQLYFLVAAVLLAVGISLALLKRLHKFF
jgi:hypothetical protein